MIETKFCGACGTANERTSKFCESCGTSLGMQEIPAKPLDQTVQQPNQQPVQAQNQQPIYGNVPIRGDPLTQFMMFKKDKLGPFLLSCFCIPGAGMLLVDSNRYVGKFIISLVLTVVIVGWVLGILWTLEAVDEHNKMLGLQLGLQPYNL